jgi:hypothetical protein
MILKKQQGGLVYKPFIPEDTKERIITEAEENYP